MNLLLFMACNPCPLGSCREILLPDGTKAWTGKWWSSKSRIVAVDVKSTMALAHWAYVRSLVSTLESRS